MSPTADYLAYINWVTGESSVHNQAFSCLFRASRTEDETPCCIRRVVASMFGLVSSNGSSHIKENKVPVTPIRSPFPTRGFESTNYLETPNELYRLQGSPSQL